MFYLLLIHKDFIPIFLESRVLPREISNSDITFLMHYPCAIATDKLFPQSFVASCFVLRSSAIALG